MEYKIGDIVKVILEPTASNPMYKDKLFRIIRIHKKTDSDIYFTRLFFPIECVIVSNKKEISYYEKEFFSAKAIKKVTKLEQQWYRILYGI